VKKVGKILEDGKLSPELALILKKLKKPKRRKRE
jgi:hypothetical protein